MVSSKGGGGEREKKTERRTDSDVFYITVQYVPESHLGIFSQGRPRLCQQRDRTRKFHGYNGIPQHNRA